jgi:hypothetical protein
MRVTILYRHPQRPDEAGMTRVPDGAYVETLKDQLEIRGFLVVEIVPAPNSKPSFINDRQPPPSLPQGRTIRNSRCR